MQSIISKQPIKDITKLIDDFPILKLHGTYNSRILEKIKTYYSTQDQQIFIANFYIYANNNPDMDLVISIDSIWEWLGYTRKDVVKDLLIKKFNKNDKIDYIIQKDDNTNKKTKETILITINCFKKLCLSANTDKANNIHDYYIKLEQIINETVSEQAQEFIQLLTQKDIDTSKLLNHLNDSKYTMHNLILQNFKGKSIFYLLIIVEENGIIIRLKFGETTDLPRRYTGHKCTFGQDVRYVYAYETEDRKEFELMVKHDSVIRNHIISEIYDNGPDNITNQTELIQLSESFTYDCLIKRLDHIKTIGNKNLVPVLKKENIELRSRITELENMKEPSSLEIMTYKLENATLKQEIAELKLVTGIISDNHYAQENLQLKLELAELKMQLMSEEEQTNLATRRKQDMDAKLAQNKEIRHKKSEHIIENGIEKKLCPGILCREKGQQGLWLPLDKFGACNKTNDKLKGECRDCKNAYEKNRRESSNKDTKKLTKEELAKVNEQRSLKQRTPIIDNKKKCSGNCELLKDISEFRKSGTYSNGDIKYKSICKDCAIKRDKEKNSECMKTRLGINESESESEESIGQEYDNREE